MESKLKVSSTDSTVLFILKTKTGNQDTFYKFTQVKIFVLNSFLSALHCFFFESFSNFFEKKKGEKILKV